MEEYNFVNLEVDNKIINYIADCEERGVNPLGHTVTTSSTTTISDKLIMLYLAATKKTFNYSI